ncbi:VanW family protein [Demequina sp. NBRC 110055]|uniref:VanW family protein n=1 Tax=Demequina sp. NBRC 110055 TaxID=1570344 RepID=UPI000A02D75E|nr:VanW family protein [Demequina sp. NBRC 110055]
MSRARNQARLEAEAQRERRRHGAAHRALRSRAARGQGAHSDATPVPVVEHTPTSELAAPTWLADAPDAPPLGSTLPDTETPTSDDDVVEADTDTRPVARVSLAAAGAAAATASAETDAESDADATAVQAEPVTAPTTVFPAAAAAPREPSAWPASVDDVRTEAMLSSHQATGERGSHSNKRGRGWLAVPVVVIVLAGLYVGAQALLSGTVPRETETLGVAIGGQSTGAAIASITEAADALAAQDITLTAEDESTAFPAADAGLGVDAEATIADLTGFTLRPERLWQHLAGGGHIDPVATVDDEALASAVTAAAADLDREAVDASVEIVGTAGVSHPGTDAIEVDVDATAALVDQAWPTSLTVEAVATVTAPSVTDETADSFAQDLSRQFLAGDVTLSAESGEAVITADQVAAHSSVQSEGGDLTLVVDGEAIAPEVIEAHPELETEPKDASVEFASNSELTIDEGANGITIDGAALGDAIVAAAGSPNRAGELPVTVVEPENSAESLGVNDFKEIVSAFDTPLTNEYVRTQNLRTAAADVKGTIIMPGEQFNLHEILSPITEAEGYADAHVIVDGILTDGIGGGLSQMATTSYNAAYFAGYDLIQHRPHSVWFPRYPAGRESTLWGTTINVIFENNTPYAALFNSYISGGDLHVDVWSTPHFEVETWASDKTNITQPGVDEVTADNCQAKGPGEPGFTITNTRVVTLDGEEVDRNVDTWTYAPNDAIKCVADDTSEDD